MKTVYIVLEEGKVYVVGTYTKEKDAQRIVKMSPNYYYVESIVDYMLEEGE